MVELVHVEAEQDYVRQSVARIDRIAVELSKQQWRITMQQQQLPAANLWLYVLGSCVMGAGLFGAGMAFTALLSH